MELFIVIVPLFIALFVVLAIYGHKKEKERRAALHAWALERGLSFREEKERGFDGLYPEFGCLRRGSNRYAYNIIEGTLEGFGVRLFDYHYETHSTDSKGHRQTHHHHFSAVIVESPFGLQPIAIRPEGILDKVTAAFGWDDIDFESAEFSRRYHVTARDKRWAFDVIHGPVMEMLLGVTGYAFEADTRAMLCHASGKRLEAAQFEEAFRLVWEILNRIPDHAKERVNHHG